MEVSAVRIFAMRNAKRISSFIAAMLALSSMGTSVNAETFRIVGTGDGYDMLVAIAAAYQAEKPSTIVQVPPSIGSGGGIAAVGSDREVLGRIARPLSESEKSAGVKALPVARIPSAFVVNNASKITALTARQTAEIYAGTITNWSEVGGADIKIKLVRREDGDSTLAALRSSLPEWKDLVISSRSKTTLTTQETLSTVQEVEGSIGFMPNSPLLGSNVTAIKLDNLSPSDKNYPCYVTLSLIYKDKTLTDEAKSVLTHATSDKAATIIKNFGAIVIERKNDNF